MTQVTALPMQKPRLSAKLRSAISHRARGKSIKDACAAAGLSESGWHKAMKRPAVVKALERAREGYVAEVERMRAPFAAAALEGAHDKMLTAKSEAVRLRAAEFLATGGHSSGPSVSVNVDARQIRG